LSHVPRYSEKGLWLMQTQWAKWSPSALSDSMFYVVRCLQQSSSLCRSRLGGRFPPLKDISEPVGCLQQSSSFHGHFFPVLAPEITKFIQLNFTACLCVFVGFLSLPFFCFKSISQDFRRGGFAVRKLKPNITSGSDRVTMNIVT